ncbi:MAG: Ig-like domain-containing protein [Solobacterium sp.]|nr:Ig-like domain-containing protein [Solobacterium sp.]
MKKTIQKWLVLSLLVSFFSMNLPIHAEEETPIPESNEVVVEEEIIQEEENQEEVVEPVENTSITVEESTINNEEPVVVQEEELETPVIEEEVQTEPVQNAEEEVEDEVVYVEASEPMVNPYWEELFGYEAMVEAYPVETEPTVSIQTFGKKKAAKVSNAFNTKEDAASYIAHGMSTFADRIELDLTYTFQSKEELAATREELVNLAKEQLDDYFDNSWAVVSYGSYSFINKFPYEQTIHYTYTVSYMLSRAQENEFSSHLQEVLDELNLWNASDYEKVKGVYDYVCSHVVYDWAGFNAANGKTPGAMTPDERLTWTAYKALMQGTAVCQGYSLLVYRMLTSLGLDCHYVNNDEKESGEAAHAWNIVNLEGNYYYLDTTWDAGESEYQYFLRGSNHFPGHTLASEQANKYVISEEDYIKQEEEQPVVEAESITLNPTEGKIAIGEYLKLISQVEPQNATNQRLVYSSSDETIATVNQNGVVAGIEKGTATITVTLDNGLFAECLVTVYKPVSAITVTPEILELEVGKTGQLNVFFEPEDADYQEVNFESSDKTIATVDANGLVTGVAQGLTEITITSENGKKATCLVLVIQPVTSISITPKTLYLNVGETKPITISIKPEDATDQRFTLYNPDNTIALLNEDWTLTGIKPGTITLTVFSTNGKTATSKVVVRQPVTSISMYKLVTITEGDTFSLKAIIQPSNASNKKVTYTSSNPKVATIDQNGLLTAIKAGTTRITAKTQDGSNLSATTLVTVEEPITIYSCTLNLNVGWEYHKNGKDYWYEKVKGYFVRQGVYGSKGNVFYDGTERGREIYDPCSDGWYWLDAKYEGAKAVDKEVFMPYIYSNESSFGANEINNAVNDSNNYTENGVKANMGEQVKAAIENGTGKWVRYDAEGKMYKGWYKVEGRDATIYKDQVGNVYYYDYKTGLMAKGWTNIGGTWYFFDPVTGVLQ